MIKEDKLKLLTLVSYMEYQIGDFQNKSELLQKRQENLFKDKPFRNSYLPDGKNLNEEEVKQYVDSVLTFEELIALFGAKEIELKPITNNTLNTSAIGYVKLYCGTTGATTGSIKVEYADKSIFNKLL